jgi:AcrR family transcriptional regulator
MAVQGTFSDGETQLCHHREVSPRPKLTESRRRDILEATITAITERGLCETRIADIAEIIGASPALVLYYFPSKAALLTDALIYQDQLFYDRVGEELGTASTAEDKLIILIEATCPTPPGGNGEIDGWHIWPATWEMARLDPALAAARARLDEAWRDQIAAIVDEGIETGEFRHVESADFAIQLSAMLDGMAIEVMLGDPTIDAARMSELARGFSRAFLK